MKRRDISLWAGMIGPVLFVSVFTMEGWFRAGYDSRSMFVSELSLGSRGWIQIVNFIFSGLLFLLFARGVAFEFREGKASMAGPLLLKIIGIALLLSGPFVMDPANTPRDEWSWHGMLHQLFGALFFSLSPTSCFVFWRRFREDAKWRSLRSWTFAAGTLIVAAILLLKIGPAQPPVSPNGFNAWVGLIQRIALITYMIWIFTFTMVLYRRKRD